jgi:hypothetical protein
VGSRCRPIELLTSSPFRPSRCPRASSDCNLLLRNGVPAYRIDRCRHHPLRSRRCERRAKITATANFGRSCTSTSTGRGLRDVLLDAPLRGRACRVALAKGPVNDTDARLWHQWPRIKPRPTRDAAYAMERGGVVRGQGRVQAGARASERGPAHAFPDRPDRVSSEDSTRSSRGVRGRSEDAAESSAQTSRVDVRRTHAQPVSLAPDTLVGSATRA